MRRLIPMTLLAVSLSLVAADETGLPPAWEVRYETADERAQARQQARELVLKHLFKEEGGFPAEDRLVIRGDAFRIGYAIDGFCSEGDVLMFVFRTSLRSPQQISQIYLVNPARQSIMPIR